MTQTTPIVHQAEPIYIVGIELRTSNDVAMQTIPPFWQRFYQENISGRIQDKLSDDVIAVYTNFENEGQNNTGTYSLIIGLPVKANALVPEGLKKAIIPSSKRAVFSVEMGRMDKVGEKWMEIWSRNDLKKTFIAEYEKYSTDGKIEIFIGIK